MKKIVFVEKEESSTYDPVSTFFTNSQAKKASSLAKPTSMPISKNTKTNIDKAPLNTQKQIASKLAVEKEKQPAVGIIDKEAVTGKIGRKGEYVSSVRKQTAPVKEESIYGLSDPKRRTTQEGIKEANEKIGKKQAEQAEFNNEEIRNEHRNKNLKNDYSKIETEDKQWKEESKTDTQELQSLKKKIKDLELREQEYIQKIEEMEENEQKLIRNEQKLQKLCKEQKNNSNESKQIQQKLKEKEEEIQKLLSKDSIPYNKKREVMLFNQIANLKRINRELVTRIKNYKGTDLVEIAVSSNRSDILFKDYTNPEGEDSIPPIDTSKLESLTFNLLQILESYLLARNSTKELSIQDDKKMLMELLGACKDISLECLGFGWKIPQNNQECLNIYDEIEKYRYAVEKIVGKEELNFIITEQNIQLINNKNEETSELVSMRQEMPKKWTNPESKKFKKASEASSFYLQKFLAETNIYIKAFNTNNIILAHSLSQLSYVQVWLSKAIQSVKNSIVNLNLKLNEAQEICELGEQGKESLFVYMQSILPDLKIELPQLQADVQDLGSIFKKVKIIGK